MNESPLNERPADPAIPAAAVVVRWEIAAIALVAPILLFPPLGRPWLLLVPLLLPAIWIVAATRGPALPITPLNGTLLLLLAAVLLSLTASFDTSYSMPKVLGVVLGASLFFAIVRAVRTAHSLDIALDLYAVAGGALAALGIFGTNWIGKVEAVHRIALQLPALIRGVPGQTEGFQPNAIGGTLLLFIPLQLSLAIAGRRRALAVPLLIFTTTVLVLTQSRNAWLSLLVATAAWAIWQSRGVVRRVLAGVMLVTAGAGAIVWTHGRQFVEGSVGRGLSIDMLSRLELWSRAITIIEDFPFTGVGMNGFRRVMPVMYPALLSPPDIDVAHCHNHLLQAGVDLGLPGLISYLALWFGVAAMLIRTFRGTAEGRVRWIAGGLGAGLLAFFGFGMGDAIALGAKVGAAFWMALALVVALDTSPRETSA